MSEQEVQKLSEEMESLKVQQAKWKGALTVVAWLLGIAQVVIVAGVGWMIKTQGDTGNAIESVETVLAVQQTRWETFMLEGPRFTSEDYDQKAKVERAELHDWGRDYVEKKVPPPEVKNALETSKNDVASINAAIRSLQSILESLQRRMDALEEK